MNKTIILSLDIIKEMVKQFDDTTGTEFPLNGCTHEHDNGLILKIIR